eukprot:GFKZ01012541.1.p1 GENE.GFKZ01012541.1~~GFKZ01012541.1.p1  ORF type:complete len:312 (-),score=26.15 GFKZ01012541.1:110-1045(-)
MHRIISLLPSTTEIIYAIGAGDQIVGVTHECDYPPEASEKRHCTGNLLPPGLTSKEIDDAVSSSLTQDPHSIYSLNAETVRNLHPTVIVTQSLCAVCAVPESSVRDLACTFPFSCRVVSADPHDLEEMFMSVAAIGKAIDCGGAADKLVERLKARLISVRTAVPSSPRPKVAVLEWPDPPYAPGHWVPDMIEAAGGICVLGKSREKSKRVTWKTLHDTGPDIIINAYCGYDLACNERECDKLRESKDWKMLCSKASVYSTNASAYFSRPGNRLIDGTELLAFILHRLPQYKPSRGCASLQTADGWIDLTDI